MQLALFLVGGGVTDLSRLVTLITSWYLQPLSFETGHGSAEASLPPLGFLVEAVDDFLDRGGLDLFSSLPPAPPAALLRNRPRPASPDGVR